MIALSLLAGLVTVFFILLAVMIVMTTATPEDWGL